MVGPFIFADLIGPEELAPGRGTDVPPHPHIGLATVTYLFADPMVPRFDGCRADDRAGRRQLDDRRCRGGPFRAVARRGPVRGVAAGRPADVVALPDELEEAPPSFQHAGAVDLPAVADAGTTVRLLVGTAFGAVSPVPGASPLYHADVAMAAGARLALPAEHPERAVLVVDGDVTVEGGPRAGPRPGRRDGRGRRRRSDIGGPARHVRGRAGGPAPDLVELRRLEPGPHRPRPRPTGRPAASRRSPGRPSGSNCPPDTFLSFGHGPMGRNQTTERGVRPRAPRRRRRGGGRAPG